MVSFPGMPAEHSTARRVSWKKPCGCWEAGCGSDGRWREGVREGQGDGGRDDDKKAGIAYKGAVVFTRENTEHTQVGNS